MPDIPAQFLELTGLERLDGILRADLAAAGIPQTTTIELTADQIAALGDVAVEVVPAPGAGFALLPLSGAFVYRESGAPFAGEHSLFGNYGTDAGILAGINGDVTLDGSQLVPMVTDIGEASTVALSDAEDAPLTIVSGGGFLPTGPIVDSSLDAGGAVWAAGDTFDVVADIGSGAVGVVDEATNAFPIFASSAGDKTFTLVGDATAFQPGDTLRVWRAVDGEGAYTIDTVGAFAAGKTVVTVVEDVADGGAVGFAGDVTLANVGVIAAYTITDPGTGYPLGVVNLAPISPSLGEEAGIDITEIDSETDGTALVTFIYAKIPV